MKTMNDLPDILNSINWQLKRIADHLDKQETPDLQIQSLKKSSSNRSIKDMLDSLRPEND